MTFALDQNPGQQAAFAIDVPMRHFGHTEVAGVAPPYRSPVPVTLYTPRNPPLPDRRRPPGQGDLPSPRK